MAFVRWLCLCWCLLNLCLAAWASSIEVFAENVDVNLQAGHTRFSRSVRVVFTPYTVNCNQADVYVDKANQKVLKVIMSGDVVVKHQNSVLKGKRVILDVQQKRLKIEGQVYTRLETQKPISFDFD